MESVKKYKVISTGNANYGKTIKAIPDTMELYTDVRTGEQYSKSELREIPEKHAVYGGLYFGRFGLFLFGREYIKYHSYQFGVGIDFINSGDAYLDIEARVACFGIGIRFVWIKNVAK